MVMPASRTRGRAPSCAATAAGPKHQSELAETGEQAAAHRGGVLDQLLGDHHLENALTAHHVHQVAAPGGVDAYNFV